MGQKIKTEMTWAEATKILLTVLESGNAVGRHEAKKELLNMAIVADIGFDAIKLLSEVLVELKQDQETGFDAGFYEEQTTPTIEKIKALLDRAGQEAKKYSSTI